MDDARIETVAEYEAIRSALEAHANSVGRHNTSEAFVAGWLAGRTWQRNRRAVAEQERVDRLASLWRD